MMVDYVMWTTEQQQHLLNKGDCPTSLAKGYRTGSVITYSYHINHITTNDTCIDIRISCHCMVFPYLFRRSSGCLRYHRYRSQPAIRKNLTLRKWRPGFHLTQRVNQHSCGFDMGIIIDIIYICVYIYTYV